MAFDVGTMKSASDTGDGDLGMEGETERWCGVLGINRAMDSALLRRKCSLGAPYSPLRLRVVAQKLNSAWGWLFYIQNLKGKGEHLVVMDIRMPQFHEIGRRFLTLIGVDIVGGLPIFKRRFVSARAPVSPLK